MHGEHRDPGGKVVLYEPSIRVPLLIRGPGIPQGVSVDDMAINADLAPTILDATGATPGRVMDGESLFGAMNDPEPSLRPRAADRDADLLRRAHAALPLRRVRDRG